MAYKRLTDAYRDIVEGKEDEVLKKLKKVKGITKQQLQMFASMPMPVLTQVLQQLSVLVASKEEVQEGPLVADDMAIVKSILNKIEDNISKAFIKKKQESVWPMLQTLAKFAGWGVSKKAQAKGRTFRYDLKK